MLTPGQLSVADGATQVTTEPHKPGVLLTVIFAGHEVNTGAWLSATATLNEQVDVLPCTSVAINVMVVVPIGNVEPLGKPAVCAMDIPGQLSLADGATQLTTAPQIPGVLFTEIFTGHEVNTGSSLSVTVTLKEHTLLLPLASVAVYEMVVVPIGKVDPLGNPAVCATTIPAQLSLAIGTGQNTVAPQIPGALFTEIVEGHEVNTGN
jgi:hypothetical protein